MASKIRVLVPCGEPHVGIMASHVRGLRSEGKHVLFITADRPYAVLQVAFRSADVGKGRVLFLDTVSQLGGSMPPERQGNARFLASPTMLEMVAGFTEGRFGIGPDGPWGTPVPPEEVGA